MRVSAEGAPDMHSRWLHPASLSEKRHPFRWEATFCKVTDYSSIDDNRVKHLEMIQDVIRRLGNDSFLIKGWAITVAGVFYGFAIQTGDRRLAGVGAITTLIFWALDVYFLRAERLFRTLFDRVRDPSAGVDPFFMGATSKSFVQSVSAGDRLPGSWSRTAIRPTISIFYLALVLFALAIAVIV